jgi:hypothetical protein
VKPVRKKEREEREEGTGEKKRGRRGEDSSSFFHPGAHGFLYS